MKFFRHSTTAREITLYPLVCWHIGAHQSDEKFIKEHVRRIKDDPHGVWFYLGDGGECVTRNSKGNIFSQTMDPNDQIKYIDSLLAPVRGKGIFGVSGNHGRRIYKDTGLDFDEQLCLRLGIPFLGLSTFFRLLVKNTVYDCFAHHGISSGASLSSKVNAAKKLNQIVVADAIFSAHSHICCELPPQHVAYIDSNAHGGLRPEIRWRTTYEYVCGCAYDSRSGYAEEKGYTPIIPAHIGVTFSGKRTHDDYPRNQSCQIWRANA